MRFTPKIRQDWRDWLMKHHVNKSFVDVVKHKKHYGNYYIPHIELMHEAICFGWIDTTVKGLDKDRYPVRFRENGRDENEKNKSYGAEMPERKEKLSLRHP